jgi:uncharacterized membrane protein YgcG
LSKIQLSKFLRIKYTVSKNIAKNLFIFVFTLLISVSSFYLIILNIQRSVASTTCNIASETINIGENATVTNNVVSLGTVSCKNLDISGWNVTLDGGGSSKKYTLTTYGQNNFKNLTIKNYGVVNHEAFDKDETTSSNKKVDIHVDGNLVLSGHGSIDVTGKGHAGGTYALLDMKGGRTWSITDGQLGSGGGKKSSIYPTRFSPSACSGGGGSQGSGGNGSSSCTDKGNGGSSITAPADYNPLPCLLYTSPSPRDRTRSRMPSSA